MSPEIHIALIHHPVMNKSGEIVTTAVTNLDIHDNARSARTFGVASYHIVTPLDAQVELVSRILGHWKDGFGARRVPNRVDAMNVVEVSRTLDDALEKIRSSDPKPPTIIATGARRRDDQVVSYEEVRRTLTAAGQGKVVILFGTGYGLAPSIFERADFILEPIGDPDGWNHLSVRSAVAITLDRLLAPRR